jgi:hypothetical protein
MMVAGSGRIRRGKQMPERQLTPDEADLRRARAAARECEVAAAELASLADRLSTEVTPAEMVEFDTLVAREAAARAHRVEAFSQLGLGVASLDRSTE